MLRWAGVLGLVGFLCGFIGPMVLTPQSNIGPIIGILMTGPGGALLGAVIGGVLAFFDLPHRKKRRALAATAFAEAVVILGALVVGR